MSSPVPHPPLPEGVSDEVLATLPPRVARSLDAPDVHLVLSELLAAGWTSPQIAARVGALRIVGDVTMAVRRLLLGLLEEDSPRRQADRERMLGDQAADAARGAYGAHTAAASLARPPLRSAPDPVPSRPAVISEEARARYVAELRRGLKGVARTRPAPEPRVRPDCAICGQESAFFVTREVHLCDRCVALLGAGAVRLAPTA